MAPTRYGDLSKKASNLLSDDYSFDNKFKLTTKSANGITFTSEGTLVPKKGLDAKLTAKFAAAEGVSVDKLQLTSAGRLVGEGTLKNAVKGVDFVVKVQDGAGKLPAGELEIKYSAPKLALDTTVDVVNGPSVSVQGTVQATPKLVVGASVKANTGFDAKKSLAVEDYNAGVAYQTSDVQVSLTTTKQFSGVKLATWVDVSKDTQVAAQVEASLKGRSLGDVSLTVGGAYQIDADSKLQAKVASNGTVSANYHINIRPGVKGVASAQIDALSLAGDAHKLGLSLILG